MRTARAVNSYTMEITECIQITISALPNKWVNGWKSDSINKYGTQN